MTPTSVLKWHPLELFDQRFRSNLDALQGRDPALANRLRDLALSRPFFIAADGDTVFLGRPGSAGIEIVPNSIPPASAHHMVSGVFPTRHVVWPIVIGGLAYGWLWDRVTKLPCKVDAAPGHRPPIYLLAGDIERLWAVLHVLDWREMLADRRFPIFAGPDAATQLRDALIDDPSLPPPNVCLRVEQHLWQQDFNAIVGSVAEAKARQLIEIGGQLQRIYSARPADLWAEKFRSGRLRVLGLTSRYTTFLQHSMRDWLAGFDRLGHETKLLIEPADHLIPGPFGCAQAVLDFKPDLIVIIDHYRAAVGPLPESIPCVMWVQDRLPSIFNAVAGRNQKHRDYCLGFGKLHLSSFYGYPAQRFLSCPVGINEQRFERVELGPADWEKFGCDVSYVSHASAPADRIVRDYVERHGLRAVAPLLDDVYQCMEAWYAGGGVALSDVALRQMFLRSMQTTGIDLPPDDVAQMLLFFNQHVGNALFRHQTLEWLAGMDLDIRLWGKGWENHPRLARFARGVADNQTELGRIYRASKINLQVTPHGSVHQRLLDGLTAGGFFLLRWHPGDAVGTIYRELLGWCQRNGIRDDAELHARADDRVRQMIALINERETSTPQTRQMSVFDVMNGHADNCFMHSADSVWPEFDQVAFNTRDELHSKVRHFLSDEAARHRLTNSMREAVVERCSYLSINRRLLDMIADDLAAGSEKCAA